MSMLATRWIVRLGGACAVAALSGWILAGAAAAPTTLRLAKAQANQFAFIPADVGVETGIFKNHGIDPDISAFAGDPKMVQALTAGSLDIALGGSPSFAAIVKGAPMKAVAVFSGAPNIIMLTVLKDGPFKAVDDIKGHTVSVSGGGSFDFSLTKQFSRRLGWGDDGIKITPLGASEAQIAALLTHQIDGTTTDSVTVEKFVEYGNGRILVKFGDYFPDSSTSCIYGRKALR